jgi:hypothetical protein
MNRMNLSSLFPLSTVNLAAAAGWPMPSPSNPMNPINSPVPMFVPVYLLPPAAPAPSPIASTPVAIPTEQPFLPAPGLPGPFGTPFMLVASSPGIPVSLHHGSVPNPAAQSSPAIFLVPVSMPLPQPTPRFAPAPGPVGLPTLAPAPGHPAFWPASPVGPMPIGPAPQPAPAAVPMNGFPSPQTIGPDLPGQPSITPASPSPVPSVLPIVGYVVQPLPTPPGAAPLYATLLPIFGMTPNPVPTPTAGSMMPPPPPAPSPFPDVAGRVGAAHDLSPQYPNGAGVIADLRAVRDGRAVSQTPPEGAVGGRGVGVGADPQQPVGRGSRPGRGPVVDGHPAGPASSGDAPSVRPVRKPRPAMNGKH